MKRCRRPWVRPEVLALAGALAFAAAGAPADAGGFSFSDHGSRSTGLAGALVAQADDPSAIFHNPGGVALLDPGKKVLVGVNLVQPNERLFQGLAPGPGAGTAAEQETPRGILPYAFAVKPLGEDLAVGLGLSTPYHLSQEWSDPDRFAGRRVSVESSITVYDLSPTAALRVTPRLGVGLGLVYRSSEISHRRRFALADPTTGQLVDVASVEIDGDLEGGFGWSAGVLHRPSERFSWGLAYRSAIAIDHGGAARLTQIPSGNPQLDALVAVTLPVGAELAATAGVDFPAEASLGAAVRIGRPWTVEVDVAWAGWSDLERIAFSVPDAPLFAQVFELRFEDTTAYRASLTWTSRTAKQLRFGLALEPSPQPDETVGPFLADSDRTVVGVGIGLDWLDVGFSWTTFDERTVRTSASGVNGSYRGSSYLLGITVGL